MISAVYVTTPPASEPVSVELARRHLRVDQTDDNDLIAIYIAAARTWAEQYLGRSLVEQQLTWTVSYDRPPNGFPFMSMPLSLLVLPMWFQWPLTQQGAMELPWIPVISVDKVSYGQWGQPDVVLDVGTDYDVDITTARVRIHPYSQVLPNDHLSVLFTTGYPEGGIPATIITAILILTAFVYENRGDTGGDMPMAAEMFLAPYRNVRFG